MLGVSRATALFAAATAFFGSVHAIQKVSREGRYLYTDDGNRFFIKGIAYQEQGALLSRSSLPSLKLIVTLYFIGAISTDPNNPFLEPSDFVDPLADGTACTRDLPFLQQLGVNAIRVYSVNSSLNHDSCMSTFSGAGIYTMFVFPRSLTSPLPVCMFPWNSVLPCLAMSHDLQRND